MDASRMDRELRLQGSYCMGAFKTAGMYGDDGIGISVTVLQVCFSHVSVPE